MKILAFDQSTRVSGFGVIQDGVPIDSGVIDLHKITDTDERSRQMGVSLCEIIEQVNPDLIVIEEVQQQTNVSTVIKLARIQGVVIGFAAAHNIELKIVTPSQWRSTLHYKQGPKVKRVELKQQSIDYVTEHFGFKDYTEDRCEAICIGVAAYELFNVWGNLD
ncbi:MAG: crossover junction endodeoxyribonuclease RuvC [Prevotellaceae bacterium]|nr:crossover junction endodeoxyribonuclease RuvC [Candidatus Faecinaster equi]